MLEWYIEMPKDKLTTILWKKHHHLQCMDALNAKFAFGVTKNQVDCHFRSCREKWHWMFQVMGKSGYGFDAAACKFNIDESEKERNKLGTTRYSYLNRTIKFFHLLELSVNISKADGSLARDQSAANASSGSDGYEVVANGS